MSHTIHNDGISLLQHAEQDQSGPITEDQILALPEPVQRYLKYAQVEGKEPVRTVRLAQKGYMRQKPGTEMDPVCC